MKKIRYATLEKYKGKFRDGREGNRIGNHRAFAIRFEPISHRESSNNRFSPRTVRIYVSYHYRDEREGHLKVVVTFSGTESAIVVGLSPARYSIIIE